VDIFFARFGAPLFAGIYQRLIAGGKYLDFRGTQLLRPIRPIRPIRRPIAGLAPPALARIAGDRVVAADSLCPAFPSLVPRHFALVHHLFLDLGARLRRPTRLRLN